MSHNPFLPEDKWKYEAVQRGLAEHKREEAIRQNQRVQESVRRLIDSISNTNHKK